MIFLLLFSFCLNNFVLATDNFYITVTVRDIHAHFTITSANSQHFKVGDQSILMAPITIADDPTTPIFTAGTNLSIEIPADLKMKWDSTITQATFTGAGKDKVGTISYADSDKTLVIPITQNFSAGETLIISDLCFTGFTEASGPSHLIAQHPGGSDATDSKTITVSSNEGCGNIHLNIMNGQTPIRGAEVSFSDLDTEEEIKAAVSNAGGNIEVYLEPDTYLVTTVSNVEGFNDFNASLEVKSEESAELMIKFIDPAGVLYDSMTREILGAGHTVTITEVATGLVAYQTVTGEDSRYEFATAQPRRYLLTVTPQADSGYTFPSVCIPASVAPNPMPGPAQNDMQGITTSRYYTDFAFVATSGDLINNDIPLDPGNLQLLKISKTVNKRTACIGDIVTYNVTIENPNNFDVRNFDLVDYIPPGFKFIEGTTLYNNSPYGNPGGVRPIIYSTLNLSPKQVINISYQLVIGSHVERYGTYSNRAVAQSKKGASISNEAHATVTIVNDPLFDEATILGKIFNDKNSNGTQDEDEDGIPGVGLATEDGIYIITDQDGKYHIQAVEPEEIKLVKVDITTLPEGSSFTTENPKMIKVTPGLLVKADFGVMLPAEFSEEEKYRVWITQKKDKSAPVLTLNLPEETSGGENGIYEDIPFNIITNYPEFIENWAIEIKNTKNDKIIKTFKGKKEEIFAPLIWDGKDEEGKLIEQGYYVAVLKIFDKNGNEDKSDEKLLKVIPKDDSEYALKPGSIKIPIRGNLVLVQGKAVPNSHVVVNGKKIYTDDKGNFAEEYILPKGEHGFKVTVCDKEKEIEKIDKKILVSENDLFLVALADYKIGSNELSGYVENVKDDPNFNNGYYSKGKLAFYLKGKVKGKYLIKAALNTLRDKEVEKRKLFRLLDPDKYYPVYGDNSARFDDINTQGKFYLLLSWDKSELTWGNFNTGITDSELIYHNRTLYGGKVCLESASTTPYGDPWTRLIIYRAKARQIASHNEFASTGGSLYYLKHKRIIEGSDKVTLEVRDKVSGLVLASKIMLSDRDYEIDCDQGRIIFTAPISSVTSSDTIIAEELLKGNKIYICVDYEYEPDFATDKNSYGARFSNQLNNNIKIGGTYIEESEGAGSYTLCGTDITLKFKNKTEIFAEYAMSKSRYGDDYISYDGGLTFQNLTTTSDLQSSAYKVNVKSDLGELAGKTTGKLEFSGSYQKVNPNFVSPTTTSSQGTEVAQAQITAKLSDYDSIMLQCTTLKLISGGNTASQNVVEGSSKNTTTVQYRHQREKFEGIIEYLSQNMSNPLPGRFNSENSQMIAVKLGWYASKKLSYYIIAQETLSGENNNQATIGLVAKPSEKLEFDLAQTFSERGPGAKANVTMRPHQKIDIGISDTFSVYGNSAQLNVITHPSSSTNIRTAYMISEDNIYGKKIITSYGADTVINKKLKICAESKSQFGTDENSQGTSVGVNYSPSEKLNIDLSLEKGQFNDVNNLGNRTAASAGISYNEGDKIEAFFKGEYRLDAGIQNRKEVLVAGKIVWKMTKDIYFFARTNVNRAYNITASFVEARFNETNIGFAIRPVKNNRLNLLTKYTILDNYQNSGVVQGQDNNYNISLGKSDIYAVEGAYDITKRWQIIEKLAYKKNREICGNRTFQTISSKLLWINRINYHLNKQWDIGLEYRALDVRLAKDKKSGWLIDISKKLKEYLWINAGYNFTDFTDNLVNDESYRVRGWFLRITGEF